ncbi:MAG: hypothetical protein P9X22_09150 [Candidatus Zapsychrus exili]|nr:hypothetical protein [Candidatus Zapsychrus exili]
MKNKYYYYARLFPAILTSMPFIVFYYFTTGTKVHEFLSFLWGLPVFADLTFSGILIFALVYLNRFLSKEVFQRIYFKDEEDMPTTRYLLLKDDHFTLEIKNQIRDKIELNFRINLLSNQEEVDDESRARKQIVMAVSQIRTFLNKNEMLLRHNMEYGFVRNFLGGCLVAIAVSLFNIYIFKSLCLNETACLFSVVLLIIYILFVLFSKFIISRFGHYYAKILYEQYLSKD